MFSCVEDICPILNSLKISAIMFMHSYASFYDSFWCLRTKYTTIERALKIELDQSLTSVTQI